MHFSIGRARPSFLACFLVAGLTVGLLGPLASESSAQAVRKQIKQARQELVAFERELEQTVEAFDRLQGQLDEVHEEMPALRKVLRRLEEPKTLYDRWTAALFRSLVLDALDSAKDRAAIINDLIPRLRKHIWEKGLERKGKIDALQDAIELLQSARAGDLITKAGVGGGQLITYSADWAAVAQCESSGRWHIDDYFDGGLQFLPTTWWGFGGGQYGHYAYQATRRQQIDIAERVLAVQGPNAWPNCFKALPADTDE